jgi:hypothetical protein
VRGKIEVFTISGDTKTNQHEEKDRPTSEGREQSGKNDEH